MTSSPGTGDTGAGERGAPSGVVSRESLREATLDGVRWVSVARVIAEAAAMAAAVVLAHLISPAEFGRLAVTVVVGELALVVANESIGTPLVQRRSVRAAHYEAAAGLGLVFGVVLTVVTWLVVPLATTPLFGARTSDLFRLFAPAFLLAGVMIVPLARQQRALAFRRISVIEIASVLVASLSSVGFAVMGLGAPAYILGVLAGLVVSTAALLATAPTTWPRWRPAEMRELLGFGMPAASAGLTAIANRNVDYLILGARLSPLSVGFYYRAFTLGVEYERKITGIVARVVFPVYSRAQDLAHMRAMRARIVRVNAILIFPLLATFAIVAPVFVPWLFGDRWAPAVLPAQILAVAGMAATVRGQTNPLVMAAGRPRALLVFYLLETALYALTVALAAPHGLVAVCIAVSAFQVAALVAAYPLLLRRLVGVPARELLSDVGPALVSCVALVAVALPVSSMLPDSLPVLARLLAVGAVAAAAYLLALRVLFRGPWSDIEMLARRVVLGRRRRSEPVGGLLLAESQV